METKLCRICGKLGENYVHIFKTEGLKNKIETCLPIIVSPHCLLPDTICAECLENVDNFYSFIKNCLQNIIILEAQYDIMESCLKTKRKHEKSCHVDLLPTKHDKYVQTDQETERKIQKRPPFTLVSYDIESDNNSDGEDTKTDIKEGRVYIKQNSTTMTTAATKHNNNTNFSVTKQYFDDAENDLINEIAQRKSLKRKGDDIITNQRTKIFKMDTSSRRKNKQPKKLDCTRNVFEPSYNFNFDMLEDMCGKIENSRFANFVDVEKLNEYTEEDKLSALEQVERELNNSLKQVCLLCDVHFDTPTLLATHIYEMHGFDMAQIISAGVDNQNEKKKKLPNLVKITDLKPKIETAEECHNQQNDPPEEPPTLQPSFVCPLCPAVLTNRSDLFTHLRVKHPKQVSLLCGLCLHIASSYVDLNKHLEICKTQPHQNITSKYTCKICHYSDDNAKLVENHVIVHDFILDFCKRQAKMFDPTDYVETSTNGESFAKTYTCTECNQNNFASFKEFSTHRRSQHQIFHCDLCNKFYGRNSHLWKHVNRLHKGHPSITCQLCYKTSASKYHLSQHFNKIHTAKPYKQKQTPEENFMSQKFQAFDFQSVKQSFMKQELLERERQMIESNSINSDLDDNSNDEDGIGEVPEMSVVKKKKKDVLSPPKEIDTSSDLYTNIITNYTPPQNEGEFKCPKCLKGFHKKTLLKKHKKNCRPRLQKDLLTRCKTCSRIFKDRQSLTKHLINYHSEYACEICGQKVQSKCEIVSHIRFSHPKCDLFCYCGNILRSKADLMEHKKDHRNSFVCQFCADMLPTKIKLKMHILSLHRKILSLSCGICLKLFETQHILRDHVRLVHKEHLTPLMSCTVCGKNYGSKWKTYDHLNKSHGRIFKACKACLEVFDTETQLEAHYNASHLNSAGQKNNNAVAMPTNSITAAPQAQVQKEEPYDSDDQNEDIDEKQSGSEISNDAETYYQNKSDSEETKMAAVPEVNVQDTKISLLEKRLLGKKMDETNVEPKTKSATTTTTTPKQKLDKKIKDYEDVQNSLQTSSKRTVYVNSNDPSLCEICLKTWPAKKHLWQHYIRCHKTVAATVCGICLKTNDDYVALQKHLRETHPTLLHGQGFGSNFICRICGRYHNASSKLKLHMAIHENFDWSILDDGYKKPENTDRRVEKNNGIESEQTDDINYESLIEQVECSSDSENDSKEDECSSDEAESDCNESMTSENSLESQMLQNMLKEKLGEGDNRYCNVKVEDNHQLVKEEKSDYQQHLSEEVDVKNEYTSSDSEDSSNSTGSFSDTEPENYETNGIKEENCTSDDEADKQLSSSNSNTNDSSSENAMVFRRKPEELDSAIRSISYNQAEEIASQSDDEFCEISTQGLNENEIESAVGSIL